MRSISFAVLSFAVLSTFLLLTFAACGATSNADGDGTTSPGTDTVAPSLPDGRGGGGADGTTKDDTESADVATAPDGGVDTAPVDVCQPDCGARVCGDDGCGGTCGACGDGEACSADGACEPCTPSCTLRFCGGDGCGGSCGECADNERCTGLGFCDCIRQCEGRVCGDDGCGGSCGRCDFGWTCSEAGACEEPCVPDCSAGCCGDDGCGHACADRCTAVGLSCDPATCACDGEGPCGEAPALASCAPVEPPPNGAEAIARYILDGYAVPLWCPTDDGGQVRDLTVFALDAADAQLFMFGEVHGTNELGPLSASIMEHLVRSGRVNTIAMEIGVDLSDPMTTFVRTGAGPIVQQGWLTQLSPNLFMRALLEKGRALALDGYELTVFGADVPMWPGSATEVVQQIANRLETTRGLVLPVPASTGGGYIDPGTAMTWRDGVLDHLAAVCDELADPAECERFEQYTNAVWLSAFTASGSLYSAPEWQVGEFFSRREDFIAFNYRVHMPNEAVRVYTHMGAAHTAHATAYGYDSAGTRLHEDYPVTAGHVYSTTPAYGPGSRILYGRDLYDLSPEPRQLSNILSDAPIDEYHVSTWRPNEACVERPQLALRSPDLGVLYADAYDAFTWVRVVTPESYSKQGPFAPAIQLFLERRDAIHAAERRLAILP